MIGARVMPLIKVNLTRIHPQLRCVSVSPALFIPLTQPLFEFNFHMEKWPRNRANARDKQARERAAAKKSYYELNEMAEKSKQNIAERAYIERQSSMSRRNEFHLIKL